MRCENFLEPIIDKELFARAQKLMSERRLEIPEEQMLIRLRILLARKGKLSTSIINDAPGVPSSACFINHFGSLREAYARIGHVTKRDCDWLDAQSHWESVLTKHAAHVAEGFKGGKPAECVADARDAILKVNGRIRVRFLIARQTTRPQPGYVARWRVYHRKKLTGLLVVLRLNETNKQVFDYVLMPSSEVKPPYLWTSEIRLPKTAKRFATMAKLSGAIQKMVS